MSSFAVVAATGRTGRLVVDVALAAGHDVTAISRQPYDLAHPRLTHRAADVLDPEALHAALAGHDVVVSALGSTGRGPTSVYSAGTAAIIPALPRDGRLVVISSAGLATPPDAGPATRLLGRVLHHVMRHPYADMARMESLLAASELAWTAVRPTRLTDRPATGRPRASIDATTRLGNHTSRADLAAYIVDHLDDAHTFRRCVVVSS
ncbi:NAD(P)-dependent oxidoreductase [Kutzneria kofuensis]|uniref:Putative NADH-flavin reductase n=1 Tax=Kutzneria kofuensis TaxID=103725 RepID=A0A7W9NKN0_9PSEU|nr:NAD(P)-binding oxidoreductase [Kutzneria kofuensis]MBB5896812.1 putative NADH-flavin reductase [Kutzneria kofuensis]